MTEEVPFDAEDRRNWVKEIAELQKSLEKVKESQIIELKAATRNN